VLQRSHTITLNGSNGAVGGTSCSSPSLAGILALLNQYLAKNGVQTLPGLGNINPQLYRLAQSSPSAFHDITSGNNIVTCAQGTPDCLTGSFGYSAGAGYDMATGLGSIDANALFTQWNNSSLGVTVTLSSFVAKFPLDYPVQISAVVAPASGSGSPTGTVAFSSNGIALGSAPLATSGTQQVATLSFPAYSLGAVGRFTIDAQYSGDTSFTAGGATLRIQVTLPVSAAAITLTAPNTVWPEPPDAQGLSWQAAVSLSEIGGVVPAAVTGLSIDGQSQSLSQYFPSPNIRPGASTTANFVFRNLATPVTRTFVFTGVDANGNSWSRQTNIVFMPYPTIDDFSLTAVPLTVYQNTAASPSCQWAVQLHLDDIGGFQNVVTSLFAGGVDLSSQIPSVFGTTRLGAWGSLQGQLCFGNITPPASNLLFVGLSNGNAAEVTVSFAGPQTNPAKLSASPANISLASSGSQTAQSALTVNTSSPTQQWTASLYPANRTTAWLSTSALSGTGNGQITLKASGAGFEPGVYWATIVLESDSAVPQSISVPVMFVLGGSTTGTAINAAVNAASFQPSISPGMILSVFGSQLASQSASVSGNPLPYSTTGVSATVNGQAAPVIYASAGQLNIQVPYAVGSGPGIVGINNNGQIAGFPIQIAPSAPAVFVDGSGFIAGNATAQQGNYATLYLTGAGEVSPALKTAYEPSPTTAVANLPVPVLPLTVTVGGVSAFVQFAGLIPGTVGTTQVNFLIPPSVPAGVQPVVVTIGNVASPPVNVTVQPQSSQ
jgi:uncharacterized protein (TIGR03437 family)